MGSKVKKLAIVTNKVIKNKYDSQMEPAEILLYIADEYKKKYGHLEIINGNEDLATMFEWIAIIKHHRPEENPHDCTSCHDAAYTAHSCRAPAKYAKNPDLFFPILAEKFVQDDKLSEAIDLYEKVGDGHRERLAELIRKNEDILKESKKNDKELIEIFESDKKSKEKVVKAPKKSKSKEGGKTKNSEEMSKDKEEKPELKNNKEKIKVEESCRAKSFQFTYHFNGTVGHDERMDGSINHHGKEIGFSMIKPSTLQFKELEELKMLCSNHENLLSVVHLAQEDSSSEKFLLLEEKVCSIEEHFAREFEKKIAHSEGPVSRQMWWDHIHHKFQLIFRGVIQGLIFLHRSCKVCGNLAFNTFVTTQSEGARILPSMDSTLKKENDVNDLIIMMKTVIMYARGNDIHVHEDCVVKLPAELVHFLNFGGTYDGNIPVSVLVDHPFFWTTEERMEFTIRLYKEIKRKNLKWEVDGILASNYEHFYYQWWKTLKGRYEKVYKKGKVDEKKPQHTSTQDESKDDKKDPPEKQKQNQGGSQVAPYSLRADIIRFHNAVYRHINDQEHRGREVHLSDAQIEADLTNFYPFFYTHMFEILCLVGEDFTKHLRTITNFCYSDSGFSTKLCTMDWQVE